MIRSWYTGCWWVGCYIWYSEEGTGHGCSPPSSLLAVPNVTAHPSAASVPITVLLYNGLLLCDFNVAIKGLTVHRQINTERRTDVEGVAVRTYIHTRNSFPMVCHNCKYCQSTTVENSSLFYLSYRSKITKCYSHKSQRVSNSILCCVLCASKTADEVNAKLVAEQVLNSNYIWIMKI